MVVRYVERKMPKRKEKIQINKAQIELFKKKLLDKFSKLEFNEELHQYKVDGRILPSVSGLIKNFYDEFDTEGISFNYANKHGFTQEQVKSAWKGENLRSTDEGSRVHIFGEDYANSKYFGIGETPLPISKQDLGIVQWWIDKVDNVPYLEPLVLELQMFNLMFGYAGTADIILIDTRDGSLIIADYKTNKELFNEFGDNKLKLTGTDLLVSNFNKYQCQFSFYQILLEEMGYKVKARILVWLQEDKQVKKLYQNYKTTNLTPQLRNYLNKSL